MFCSLFWWRWKLTLAVCNVGDQVDTWTNVVLKFQGVSIKCWPRRVSLRSKPMPMFPLLPMLIISEPRHDFCSAYGSDAKASGSMAVQKLILISIISGLVSGTGEVEGTCSHIDIASGDDCDEEIAGLIHLKTTSENVTVKTSTCLRSNASIYLDHLQNGGKDCWEACGKRGGFCDFCGGHLCCAPNGEGDEGCHKEVCKDTGDWPKNWFQRRRHSFCSRIKSNAEDLTLTQQESQVEVPQVTTETDQSHQQSHFRLLNAFAKRPISGNVASLVDWFDFVSGDKGHVAQFRFPKGQYQAKNCNLAQVLPVLNGTQVDIIGAGYSYYLKKTSPKSLSINMGECKCAAYSNGEFTACAGDLLGDALRILDKEGRKLPTFGSFHHVSFGGMVASFSHGSNAQYNSIVDTMNWMEIYDLKSKSFQVIKNLTMIKQVIASRSFIMTRANFKTETNPFVLTVATQTSGNELVDMEFLDSLDKVENLVAYQRFERDGTYMIEAFGSRPLTMEQINILHKRAYSPHVCAKEYGKCRFVDFLVADDDLDDENHGIFGYSFDLNGHVVKASQVEGWWDATEPIGSNFFGERVSFPAKKCHFRGLAIWIVCEGLWCDHHVCLLPQEFPFLVWANATYHQFATRQMRKSRSVLDLVGNQFLGSARSSKATLESCDQALWFCRYICPLWSFTFGARTDQGSILDLE